MMSRRTVNLLLLAVLCGMAVLLWIGPTPVLIRNFEYFPDMVRSPRYNTFAANPNFADGKTLQPAVAGTVALDRLPGASVFHDLDIVPRPAEDLPNPFPTGDADALRRGHTEFVTFCQPCHGATGGGDGPIVAHGFAEPPSLVTGSAATSTDTELFRVITRGTSEMPAYAAQIAPSDRWRIVLYVRSLQQPAAPGPTGGTTK